MILRVFVLSVLSGAFGLHTAPAVTVTPMAWTYVDSADPIYQFVIYAQPLPTRSAEWALKAVADFDHDGKSDLVWRNTLTGANEIWIMGLNLNQPVVMRTVSLPMVAVGAWDILAAADANGDGYADLFWTDTHHVIVWRMVNAEIQTSGMLQDPYHGQIHAEIDPDMSFVGAADLTGDGRADLLWMCRER